MAKCKALNGIGGERVKGLYRHLSRIDGAAANVGQWRFAIFLDVVTEFMIEICRTEVQIFCTRAHNRLRRSRCAIVGSTRAHGRTAVLVTASRRICNASRSAVRWPAALYRRRIASRETSFQAWITAAEPASGHLSHSGTTLRQITTTHRSTNAGRQQLLTQPFKVQWCQMVTFRSVQCHPGLTYTFNFWHSGTLALSPERQSARMSEIKSVG